MFTDDFATYCEAVEYRYKGGKRHLAADLKRADEVARHLLGAYAPHVLQLQLLARVLGLSNCWICGCPELILRIARGDPAAVCTSCQAVHDRTRLIDGDKQFPPYDIYEDPPPPRPSREELAAGTTRLRELMAQLNPISMIETEKAGTK